MKAIALISGGLDSTLAAKVIKNLGIEVEGIHFLTPFTPTIMAQEPSIFAKNAAEYLGIKLVAIDIKKKGLEILKKPRFGYGQGLNPCIDCRISMLKEAKKYMQKVKASFVVTGEVLGQRPMSQRKDTINLIERESGLTGYLLRPLTAKNLPPTIPEQKEWVERENLLDIHGRSRKIQMQLAQEWSLKDYATPAGGCLLTDASFARRVKDLMEYKPEFSVRDFELLKIGRHFRVSPQTKVIIGRNEDENGKMAFLAKDNEMLLEARDFKGPLSLIDNPQAKREEIAEAACLIAFYGKGKDQDKIWIKFNSGKEEIEVKPGKEGKII